MEFSMEWNVICRVCLQEGEMYSIFEKDESEVLICDKIMHCSNIKIERGVNLPENICKKCLDHLQMAYSFRNNCESSDAVLQSFVNGNMVNDLVICTNGEIYKYKPPQGLKVKRIPKEKVVLVKKEAVEEVKVLEVEEPEPEPEPEAEAEANDEAFLESGEFDRCEEEEEHQEIEMGAEDPPSPSPTEDHPSPSEDPMSPYEMSEKFQDESNSNHPSEPNLVAMSGYMVIEDGPNVFTVKVQDENTSMSLNEDSGHRENEPNITIEPQTIFITRQPKPRAQGDKPMHICEICGNSYKHRHSLETHMRRHRNEKPFACEICGRGFVLNVELKSHMRTHTGQKPYPCRFCGRRFSDFGSRIKHERTHTGERPYACETCGKAFAYSYGLTSHILTHTGEKRFECDKCGKRFAKKHHLKNHLNTHTKQETRLKHKGVLSQGTSANNFVNTTSNSGIISSEDEYSSMLTVFTGDQNIEQSLDQYMDINVVEIKQEIEEEGSMSMQEIQEMTS